MRAHLAGASSSISSLCFYYLSHISKHMTILLPLSLLVASIKVLTQRNERRELLALLSAGLSKKKISAPFLLVGCLTSLLLFVNFELWMPRAIGFIEAFDMKQYTKKQEDLERLYVIPLKCGSKIYLCIEIFKRYGFVGRFLDRKFRQYLAD